MEHNDSNKDGSDSNESFTDSEGGGGNDRDESSVGSKFGFDIS